MKRKCNLRRKYITKLIELIKFNLCVVSFYILGVRKYYEIFRIFQFNQKIKKITYIYDTNM